jgi:hypothetical protein
VVESCRKDYLTAKTLLEAKVAALRYQSPLSKLSTKAGRGGKRSAGNQIDGKVIDRLKSDRQVENSLMSAGTREAS